MELDLALLFRSLFVTVAALLPLINPPADIPIFLSLTRHAAPATRVVLARRIALNTLLLLLGAMLLGSHVLAFFGISLPVVKIGGGLLVVATGWQLVSQDEDEETPAQDVKSWEGAILASRAFYPLTFPLTTGPEVIAVALTLGVDTHEQGFTIVMQFIGTLVGLLVLSLLVYLGYRYAARFMALLGPTGKTVFLRLSAFILLCIGMSLFCDGLAERFPVFESGVAIERMVPTAPPQR